MATITEDPVDEDSRTATFERKRPHDVTSSNNSSDAASNIFTPRKRTKPTGKSGYRDIHDFFSSEAGSTTSTTYTQEGQGTEKKQEYQGKTDGQTEGDLLSGVVSSGQDEDLAVNEGSHLHIGSPPMLVTEAAARQTSNGYPVEHGIVQDTVKTNNEAQGSASTKASRIDESVDSPTHDSAVDVSISEARRLYLGNTPYATEEKHLREFFHGFPIERILIPTNPRTSRPVGYAFVDLTTSQAAEAAKSQLSGKDILARKISVQLARKPAKVTSVRTRDAEGSSDPMAKETVDEIDYQHSVKDFDSKVIETILDVVTEPSPKLSWNAVNNISIRTTLGGGLGKAPATMEETPDTSYEAQAKLIRGQDEAVKKEELKSLSDIGTPQEKATQTALTRLEGFRDRLAGMDSHDGPVSAYQAAKVELKNAEIDYNYCLYHPCNEDFSPPPTQNRNFHGNKTATQQKRWRMWNLTSESMEKGTLQDLKDGKLTGIGTDSASGKPLRKPSDKASTLDKFINNSSLSGVESAGHSNISEEPHIKQDMVEFPPDPDAFVHTNRSSSESDGDLILNTHNDHTILSEGKINKRGHLASDVDELTLRRMGSPDLDDWTSNETTEAGSFSDADSVSESECGDDMMDYMDDSNLERVDGDVVARSDHLAKSETSTSRVLADLSSQDLNAQIRYFYVTKVASGVDPSKAPVRCLVCAEHGHMADACEVLTCGSCGLFNRHTTQNCPSTRKCSKCREEGHNVGHCPYKLKNMPASEVICDLCQRNGHVEEDCELLWRTSGRPWEFEIANNKVRLSCYECGRSGHLGNDCPTRKPGKSLGTSSWGSGKDQLFIKSKNELKIKGSARQDPIDIDEEGDGTGMPFVRPRISEPARKGKIQIKSANPSFQQQSPYFARTFDDSSQDSGRSAQMRDNQYNGGRRGRGDPVSNGYSRFNTRPNDRRSMAPDHPDRGGYGRGDQIPLSTYHDRPAPPAGDTYRPMPSSARNAWSRHRT